MSRLTKALAGTAAGLLLAILGACSTGNTQDDAAQPAAGPGFGHIHGLGVDPAGGVYAATHFGLFRIHSPQDAERVAGRFQDTMGFTIIGPGMFLASGHPAVTDIPPGGSPHLGLIRSTDAGVTWTSVSEAGTADFHALAPAGTSLYAYDSLSGQVRRSDDGGHTWIDGARVQAGDLAAHADQPDLVYATTPDGLQESVDGGQRFTRVTSAPTLHSLDAVGAGVLVGLATDGTVHLSRDDGTTWQETGRLPAGPPTAFTAVDHQHLLAATRDGSVFESRDTGRTFTPLYSPEAG